METILLDRKGYTSHAWQGNNYKSDLRLKDIAKIIKQELKKEFPSCVFSLVCQLYSGGQSLSINLMKADFEVFNKTYTQDKNGNIYDKRSYEYAQLNHYTVMEIDGYCNGMYLTKEAQQVLKRAVDLSNSFNFDDSDGQIDYFHTNFYLHLAIGKWDKPFQKI